MWLRSGCDKIGAVSEISHLVVGWNVVGDCDAAVTRLVQCQRSLIWTFG